MSTTNLSIEQSKNVKDSIECNLVITRLNRYLVGEQMPERLLGDVEGHLLSCPPCRSLLKKRKSALQSMLALKSEQFIVSKPIVDSSEKISKKDLLLSFLTEKQESLNQSVLVNHKKDEKPVVGPAILEPPQSITPPPSQSTPRPLQWKSLSIAFLFGIGLVVINYVGADPTKIFGQKVFTTTKVEKIEIQPSVVKETTVSDEDKKNLLEALSNNDLNLQKEVTKSENVIQWLQKFEETPIAPETSSIILDFAFECMKNEVFDASVLNHLDLLNDSQTKGSVPSGAAVQVVPVLPNQNPKLEVPLQTQNEKELIQNKGIKKFNYKNKTRFYKRKK